MRSFKSRRGSILLVAMIFALSVAIFLGSYMSLAIQSLKLSNRSFYSNAAMNLVDTGLEQAMWALNKSTWTGFSTYSTGQYQGTFPSSSTYYNLSGGVKAQVKVWANPNGSPAQAVAEAIITFPNTISGGQTIIKEAEIYLTQASYFKAGLIAKNTITFSGNATVDGWNSDPSGTIVPYSAAAVDVNGTANGKVGSADTAFNSIDGSGNASIYGYAEVGGNSSSDITMGHNGVVGPYGSSGITPAYVTYDFTTSFPDVSTPTPSTVNTISAINLSGNNTQTLPGAGDMGVTTTSGGVTTTTYYYNVPSVSLSGNAVLNITANQNVVFLVTQATGSTVTASGNGGINIPTGSSLVMYSSGDVSISGNGIMNGGTTASTANQPVDFQLYGTRSASNANGAQGEQNITVSGNGVLSGVVYAPNSNITMSGNGDTLGAMVGNSVTMSGNGNFHYDQSLANLGNSASQSITKYRELYTLSDRATYATQLNF